MTTATDGSSPFGIFVADPFSNFIGTTLSGGAGGVGTIVKMSTLGTVTVLHAFSGADGNAPEDGVITDGAGNFYGVTFNGGSSNAGTIFSITATGTFTSLYSFNGTTDGKNPHCSLVIGPDGFLYGTAEFGGANNAGTFFRLSAGGTYTVLHNFVTATEGANPVGQLVLGPDNNLYGTCATGGASGAGSLVKITLNGAVTNLHSFTNSTEGLNPSNIMLARDGVFYGTSEYGGVTINNGGQVGIGALFSYSPTLHTFTVLHRFTAVPDAENPFGALVQATDNNIYGTTLWGGTSNKGTLYRFAPGANDTSKPSTSITISGTQGANGWYKGSVQITLSATDLDGAANVAATYYTIGGGPVQTYTGPITISAESSSSFSFWSVDWARNVEAANTRTINIDSTPPVTTASVSGTLHNGLYMGSATITRVEEYLDSAQVTALNGQ